MKRILTVSVMLVALFVAVYAPNAQAAAVMFISDSTGGSANCDNSQAFSAVNSGAGFLTAANASSITFQGSVGGFSIERVLMIGNQPGTPVAANVLDAKFNILHTSGTGFLTIDFGGNNFTIPAGPGLFLSAATTASYGESQATDSLAFQAWGKADNTLTIPGGTATAVAPVCVPGAGLTTACATVTADVGFVRGGGPFSLTGRQTITQSTSDTLGASYTATVAANSQPTTQVPEPTSFVLLGAGLLLLASRRLGKK
jgi:hypothetical protein